MSLYKSIITLVLFLLTQVAYSADGWTANRRVGNFLIADSGGIYVTAANKGVWSTSDCKSRYVYIIPGDNTNRMLSTIMLATTQNKTLRFYGDCNVGAGIYFYADRVIFQN